MKKRWVSCGNIVGFVGALLTAGSCDDVDAPTEPARADRQQAETATNDATITTDQGDYSPGDIALLSGTGWAGGETVGILIECTCGCSDALAAIADEGGAFADIPYNIEEKHLGATCDVTAAGETSGRVARTS